MTFLPFLAFAKVSLLSNLSEAAYNDTPRGIDGWRVTKTLGDVPLVDGVFHGSGGAEAVVFRKGNEIVVAFRGTQENSDKLLVDSKILVTHKYPKSYTDNFAPLLKAVAEAYPGHAITFTGHSLGGPSSMICPTARLPTGSMEITLTWLSPRPSFQTLQAS